MNVDHLTDRDFEVKGRHNKTLNINRPGPYLVFFKMDTCKGCAAFEPVFHSLAGSERRVKFFIEIFFKGSGLLIRFFHRFLGR